jgi:hypothetical protein
MKRRSAASAFSGEVTATTSAMWGRKERCVAVYLVHGLGRLALSSNGVRGYQSDLGGIVSGDPVPQN